MIVSVFVRRLRESCRSNRRRCAMYHVQAEYDFTALPRRIDLADAESLLFTLW